MKKSRGFTLVELLVVIAIIGILASIVLVSLTGARNRARQASMTASVSQIRSAAEMSFSDAGNYNDVCTEVLVGGSAAGNSTLSAAGEYARLNAAIDKQKGGTNNAVCNEAGTGATSTAYAVWVELIVDTAKAFCIDSAGNAKEITKPTAADVTVCP